MPRVVLPRVGVRLPRICVLTGQTEGVELRRFEYTHSRRLPGRLRFLPASEHALESIELPFHPDAYARYDTWILFAYGAVFLGVLGFLGVMTYENFAGNLPREWRTKAMVTWLLLVGGGLALPRFIPGPRVVASDDRTLTLEIPSAEAAAAITAYIADRKGS